jgi:cation transport regulator ChaB
MNTPEKEKAMIKSAIDRGALIKAMTEVMLNTSSDMIKVPVKYRDQVLVTKDILKSDVSGLVNSLLDFAISCALVNYSVETTNPNLTDLFKQWLGNLNSELRGKIPVGISALAKEYFRERWKGSSFLLLRSVWEDKDGYIVPTKLWFVDGEDILIDNKSETVSIGSEKYNLKTSSKTQISIPVGPNERIFVQKPYDSWGTSYPTPYLIRRGIYRNLRLMEILTGKAEFIVGKALEYLLLLKKGTENLALAGQSEFTYSSDDLKKVKENLETVLTERRYQQGVPTYATNFDTDVTHLIPEYDKALKQELYTPIERKILAGLGMIDVLQGVASTRKESVLNPRPFVAEVQNGIEDFKMMLTDIMQVMIQLNSVAHPKYFGQITKIHSTPITHFITDELRTQLRSMYDRGTLSKQTYAEVVGDIDFSVELERRKGEMGEVNAVMYPPVIQNQESSGDTPDVTKAPKTPDKTGPEAKNYKATLETADEQAKVLEGAPYQTITDLPSNVTNVLPAEAQKVYMRVFNESYPKGEDYARKVAWTVIKKLYKKVGDKWVPKRTKASIDDLIIQMSAIQDLEIKEHQLKLLKKLNEGEK